MEKHFTATAYIVQGEKTLLIYHRKMKKWLPPGGHVDLNETPVDAVKREVFEETGLEVEIFKDENIWIDRWNAVSIERPYMCLLQNIPKHLDKPAHQHMDMIYLTYPTGGSINKNEQETSDIRWFSAEELNQLIPDEEIFVDTVTTLKKIWEDLPRFLQFNGEK